MRALPLLFLASCILGGCAAQRADDSQLKPISTTTGDEAPERMRARVHSELAAVYYELGNMSVALEEVKEAIRSDPNYAPANTVAGLIYGAL